jgi:hypothetical protein
MTREKRLSPRRAQSLAALFLRGRTRGSPKTTPYPPAASADRRHTERETPRFGTLVNALLLDARLHSARLTAGVRLSPTARLQRKSTVCGLSGLRPCSAGSPPIKSSTRLGHSSRLLRRSLFVPCQPENSSSRFGKEKLQCKPIFLSNSGIERFLERIIGNRAWPSPAGAGRRPVNTELN